MVDADLGITFLPEMAEGSALLTGTRVETHPLPERSYREIGLAWRQGSTRGAEFRALGEHLVKLSEPARPTASWPGDQPARSRA